MSDEPSVAISTPEEAVPVDRGQGISLRASEQMIRDALSEVYDPEIGIDVVSLGLVYGTAVDESGLLTVDMTLTSPYCPLASILQSQVHAVCAPLPGVEDVRVNLVWDPPWDPRTMASDEVKLELGIY
ncbi:MAG: metal-sulfur cluster assembly factor [Candidatus Dormibacteria bacterium]|jgi:metal-sulfur cluster biosynthetic enzyme